MAQKPLIAVIGSLNIDFVTLTPRVPAAGETLTAASLAVHAGGKGANQAVACGRASFKARDHRDIRVEMIGCVGQGDPYYTSLLKPTLESSGVGTSAVKEISDSQTGTATILVEHSGQNRILVVPGANFDGMRNSKQAIELGRISGEPDILVMQGEIPRDTTFEIIHYFSRCRTQIVLNPAPVYTDGIPLDILSQVDILIVNETELALLTRSLLAIDVNIKVEDLDNIAPGELGDISKGFHEAAGVKFLLVTLGADGVFYSMKNGEQEFVAGVRVKADDAIDTTAAGDTFVGYFAAELARHIATHQSAEGFNLAGATVKANAAAALCVQRSGAMQSIPFGYEVN